MARKLASIKRVSKTMPIKGKDRIVLGMVDGWQVIINKDQIQDGDKVVYCEIDSVLPEKPEFEFLRSKKFRIKTMKMAGVISQGICFPLDILPPGNYQIGDDVTELIGVKQYEPTMDNDKEAECEEDQAGWRRFKFLMRYSWFRKLVLPKKESQGFPGFISKTDEVRIQNAPYYLNMKTPFVATEKVDGQSGSFCLVRHKGRFPFFKETFEYIVCSRNHRLPEKDSTSYWAVSDRYDLKRVLRNLIGAYDWVAVQGECIARNVQGNKYQVDKPDFYVFNLIYPDGRVDSETARTVVEREGLKFVPILATDYILPDSVQEVLEYAHGQSRINPQSLREGIVFRSKDGKQSFKAVDPLFLLKYDE